MSKQKSKSEMMEKVEQKEIVFDNISEYSSAFPRFPHKQTNAKKHTQKKQQHKSENKKKLSATEIN